MSLKNQVSRTAMVLVLAAQLAGAQAPETTSRHGVTIDPNQPFPSIMFSDILKSMSDQVMWEKGQLRFFERVRMTFLPDFHDPQHIAPYNPNTGAFIVSELSDASGSVLQTVFWEARKERFPYWSANAVNNSDPQALSEGDYTLTWKLDGAPFWKLPFSVKAQPAASAYDAPNTLLEGPWEEWAYIYVPNGNLSQAPTFNFFLRNTQAKPGNWVETEVTVRVERDGELVAQHNIDAKSAKSATYNAKPWWISQELALRNPDNSGFAPAADILQAGNYTVTLNIDGKTVGTYEYTSDGGALPFKGRQDRESAKPLEYLEGATDRFYLKRQ